MKKLLVVEDAFVANGRGILVLPKITIDAPPPGEFKVKLRAPSGEEREVKASLDVAHIRGKLGAFAMYRLYEVTPEEVPPGTELFSVD